MSRINWRAMQAAGAFAHKNKSAPASQAQPTPYGPQGVLPRYMAAGSRHANLSKEGKKGS